MMKFHPTEDLLVEYASGSLPWHLSIGVSVHVGLCKQCREQVESYQCVAANLFEEQKPFAVADGLLEATLAKIDASAADSDVVNEKQAKQDENKAAVESFFGGLSLPRALKKLLPNNMQDLTWKSVTSGLQVAELVDKTNQYKISLHRIKAGAEVPEHTHKGNELTVVLEGGFSDRLGAYNEGDFVLRTGEHTHSPRASENEDCICLTIVENPIKLTGFFGRFLNPFLK